MQKEVEKRLFVEVDVEVIIFGNADVLTESTPKGAYDDLNDWGGLEEVW